MVRSSGERSTSGRSPSAAAARTSASASATGSGRSSTVPSAVVIRRRPPVRPRASRTAVPLVGRQCAHTGQAISNETNERRSTTSLCVQSVPSATVCTALKSWLPARRATASSRSGTADDGQRQRRRRLCRRRVSLSESGEEAVVLVVAQIIDRRTRRARPALELSPTPPASGGWAADLCHRADCRPSPRRCSCPEPYPVATATSTGSPQRRCSSRLRHWRSISSLRTARCEVRSARGGGSCQGVGDEISRQHNGPKCQRM